MLRRETILLAALLGGLGGPALAQLPPPPPAGSPLPRVEPLPPPAVSIPTLPAPEQPAKPVPAADVTVRGVAVEGVTAYKRAEILALAGPGLIGPAVPLARIEAARAAILRRYREDGYVLSGVSVNIDASGALRFLVT